MEVRRQRIKHCTDGAAYQAAPSVHYTTNLKHSLVLLRMGRNYRPKHAELIESINKIIIVASSWLFILFFVLCKIGRMNTKKKKVEAKACFFFYFCSEIVSWDIALSRWGLTTRASLIVSLII